MNATNAEVMGWMTAILMLFIPPVLIFLFLKFVEPTMKYKRSISFFVGWIPGNLVALGYLCWTIKSPIDFFFLLFFCEVVQAVFIFIMHRLFVGTCGENAFD